MKFKFLYFELRYSFNQISMEFLTFSCTSSFNSEEDVPVSYHFHCECIVDDSEALRVALSFELIIYYSRFTLSLSK